jgi:succinate dehydrogenase/fumarate reductase-like Fe-S protein
MEAKLRIRRGGEGEVPRYDTFIVPFEEGTSVLDALMWLRRHRDSSIAVRYSCINANACKECSAVVDGEVTYLCTARLKEGEIVLEPLPRRRLIRDLVTDILPHQEEPPTEAHRLGPPLKRST